MPVNDKGYTNDALNEINRLFYSSVEEVFKNAGLADFFIKIEPIQIALAKKIEELIPKATIKVKELGSGNDFTRWEIISRHKSNRNWIVILTDFSTNSLPDLRRLDKSKTFNFSTEKLDLLKPFKQLTEKEKVDVILITYGFDSVWFPQDAHLEKRKNAWYRVKYKVSPLNNVKKITDFQKIKIWKKLKKVNLKYFEFGNHISEYYSHKTNVIVNFPGGLIKKVLEAFKTQISSGGIFVIGDMAVDNTEGRIIRDSPNGDPVYMNDYSTSGKVAKFKIEDYGLAKIILETKGFKVKLESIEDFLKKSGYKIPLEVKDHFFMIIRENRSV